MGTNALKSTVTTMILSLFASATMAMTVNITFGSDIMANKDSLNVSHQILTGAFPDIQKQENTLEGIESDKLLDFVKAYSDAFYSKIQAINDPFTKEYSYITLGYNKNGSTHVPASCQKINISNQPSVNIKITEDGCSVF